MSRSGDSWLDTAIERSNAMESKSETESNDYTIKHGHEDETDEGVKTPKDLPETGPLDPRPDIPAILDPSPSASEWEEMKKGGYWSPALDELMGMVGMEDVKRQLLKIKILVHTAREQRVDLTLKDERFSIALLGNPGTGKTTVAKIYRDLIFELGVLWGNAFESTHASYLCEAGVSRPSDHIETIQSNGGGIFFVDNAHHFVRQEEPVLQHLMAEVEAERRHVAVILAGYPKDMERLPGIDLSPKSRIPIWLRLPDYSDKELLQVFVDMVRRRFNDQMKVEGGYTGLYARVCIRRIGKDRGTSGFGNIRAVENVLSTICERQAHRLHQEAREMSAKPDRFLLTKDDLLGPEPSVAFEKSDAWKELQRMTGLDSVKQSIRALGERATLNYRRELLEKDQLTSGLNRVFLGSPGTGKTTVARLYGRLLADMGLLSTNNVKIITPTDLIGQWIGESEANTRAVLTSAKGEILVIDEAYMLDPSRSSIGSGSCPYRTAIIDTIVGEVQGTPGEDRCVLLLGYEEPMKALFQAANPGFARRFPMEDASRFEDFTRDELKEILDSKLASQQIDASSGAKRVALDVLDCARKRPNFGNGGEVDNLLSRAKMRYQQRESVIPAAQRDINITLVEEDFDLEFKQASNVGKIRKEIFKDVVGCDAVIAQLEGYQQMAVGMHLRGIDPREHIPTNFIFKGPPGTGKTTTARKVGRIFYEMGFLTSDDVVESSVSDLVGEYAGQTGPKTRRLLESALGKVLFIDEAYRLASSPWDGQAVDELVDCLTKIRFIGKIVVVLAGYEHEMDSLLSTNPGLRSRFPTEIRFEHLPAEQCFQLLKMRIEALQIKVTDVQKHSFHHGAIISRFEQLKLLPTWGNGRDVETLAKIITGDAFKSLAVSGNVASELTAPGHKIVSFLDKMLAERKRSANVITGTRPRSNKITTCGMGGK